MKQSISFDAPLPDVGEGVHGDEGKQERRWILGAVAVGYVCSEVC